jgi:hypothetical protein
MPESANEPTKAPNDEELRLIICRTMEQMFLQAQASEKLLLTLNARIAGVEAVAPIVDSNQAEAATARQVAAQKELIAHFYERGQQYVAVIVAGGFAAYFATLSVVAPRLPNHLLLLSAVLMTISLGVFVFWEVFSITWTSYSIMRGKLGSPSRALQMGWGISLLLSIGTALPAICLSLWAYLRGLGVLN